MQTVAGRAQRLRQVQPRCALLHLKLHSTVAPAPPLICPATAPTANFGSGSARVWVGEECDVKRIMTASHLALLYQAEVRKQMQALNNYYDNLPSAENLLLLLSAEVGPRLQHAHLPQLQCACASDADSYHLWQCSELAAAPP